MTKEKIFKTTQIQTINAQNPQRTLSRVPHLVRKYNTIEQNIIAVSKLNRTVSHTCNSPIEDQKQINQSFSVDETFYQYPSQSNTRKENQIIIDKIQYQFSIFKLKNQIGTTNKYSLQPKMSQTFSRNSKIAQNQTQYQIYNNFLCKLKNCYTKWDSISLSIINNEQFKTENTKQYYQFK